MKRHTIFLLSLVLAVFLFSSHLSRLFQLASDLNRATYSHILIVPLISLYFLGIMRKEIFHRPSFDPMLPFFLFLGSGILYAVYTFRLTEYPLEEKLPLAIASFVVLCMALFAASYGKDAFRKAMFPLLFLLFMIPPPTSVLDMIIRFLRKGSAELSYMIFKLTGTPIFRDGFTFFLPGITIEVAEECSGIRSSIGLLLTTIIAGFLLLERPVSRMVLLMFVVPLVIVKNSIRIVTLSLLAIHVNKSFLTNSALHHNGGVVFFLITLGIFFPVLIILRKREKERMNRFYLPLRLD